MKYSKIRKGRKCFNKAPEKYYIVTYTLCGFMKEPYKENMIRIKYEWLTNKKLENQIKYLKEKYAKAHNYNIDWIKILSIKRK